MGSWSYVIQKNRRNGGYACGDGPHKRDGAATRRRLGGAREHLRFVFRSYAGQLPGGRRMICRRMASRIGADLLGFWNRREPIAENALPINLPRRGQPGKVLDRRDVRARVVPALFLPTQKRLSPPLVRESSTDRGFQALPSILALLFAPEGTVAAETADLAGLDMVGHVQSPFCLPSRFILGTN